MPYTYAHSKYTNYTEEKRSKKFVLRCSRQLPRHQRHYTAISLAVTTKQKAQHVLTIYYYVSGVISAKIIHVSRKLCVKVLFSFFRFLYRHKFLNLVLNPIIEFILLGCTVSHTVTNISYITCYENELRQRVASARARNVRAK